MCPQEKIKLRTIEEGANKTIVDENLDTESTNPIENQAVTNELNTKVTEDDVMEMELITKEQIDEICNDTIGDGITVPEWVLITIDDIDRICGSTLE